MNKFVALAVAGGAYVLGARAGRERYEQITRVAKKVWRDPRVQRTTSEATGLIKDQVSKVAIFDGSPSSESGASVSD